MIQRHFKLALTAGHSLPLVINANQYDSGEQWLFTLYSDGVKYTPSTGAIVGIKADRLGIINTGSVDEAGRVVINETRQMTAAVGKNIFELLIDDQTHGTANFMVLVEPRPGDNADLSESDYSLFEEAIQGTSQTAIIAGVQEWMDENLTDPTDPIVDASLSLAGAAADAKKTGDEITALKSAIAQGSGLTTEIKVALLNIFKYVQYLSAEGETAYAALETALNPPTNLSYITAVYTQGSTIVYDTDTLDSLRSNLVVTAHYDDLTTETVIAYTLSGSLTAGTSTITVSYSGKTTTFDVTVTHMAVPVGYTPYDYLYRSANFGNTQLKATLIKTQTFDNLNNKIIDFEFMPTIALASATAIVGGSTGTGNSNQVAFFTRTDTKRVSCFSHGTALAIENVDSIAVNSKTHVNLNPHSASPSTLTVGSETYDGAWTDSKTIATELTICGNSAQGTSGNGASYEGVRVGTVKVYNLNEVLLGEYIPCVRDNDNVIGVYDTVGGNFYTASNASYATIGHSNCSFGVGNW